MPRPEAIRGQLEESLNVGDLGHVGRHAQRVVAELRKALGVATNNRAEYEALVMGLEEARRQGITDLMIRLDSELLVKQMRGEYRIKNEALRPLAQRAIRLIAELGARIEHVPRAQNEHADRLANEAIDRDG